mmetsp:Transcript_47753/g.144409  ORF Transcript_47753/g.144409 Transcript_47753/m.144409 type:complete len:130 (-) Transcript_47753:2651-3040(-)
MPPAPGPNVTATAPPGKGKVAKAKRSRKRKIPGQPKGPVPAFLLFQEEICPAFDRKKLVLSFGDLVKKIIVKCKTMLTEEKGKYGDLAEADKRRYAREMDSFRHQMAPVISMCKTELRPEGFGMQPEVG